MPAMFKNRTSSYVSNSSISNSFSSVPEELEVVSSDKINFFNSSSQAMAKLLAKQSVGRAVKPIQDVMTCWWSA
jgi:hypothetical protein